MRLCRSGAEPLLDLLVRLNGGDNHAILAALDANAVLVFSLRHEHPVHHIAEDSLERVITVRLNIDYVVVTDVAVSDRLLTARRLHGCTESDANELAEIFFANQFIPALVVHPLTEELDGRLSTVLLFLGHVEVIDKDDSILAEFGTPDTLTAPIHATIDDVLGLVGGGLGREGEAEEGAVLVLEVIIQLLAD